MTWSVVWMGLALLLLLPSFVTSYSAQTHNHQQLTKKAKATTASVKEFVDVDDVSDDTLGHKCSIKEIF